MSGWIHTWMTVLPVVDGTHSHELVFTVYLFNSPDKPSQNVENLFDLGPGS